MREEEILQMTLEEAYHVLASESKPPDKVYKKVRFGINQHFDINIYFAGHYTIKTKTGYIILKGNTYTMEDINTELENRERILKEYLIERYTGNNPLKLRD